MIENDELIINGIKNIKHRVTHLSTIRRNNRCLKLAKNIINDKYDRIYHYHVRKTGGKSILFIFMANECQDYYNKYENLYTNIDNRIIINNKVFVKWHPILLQQGNYFFGSSHIPHHQFKLPARTFTITSLRNPVDRIVAHYAMLMQRKNKDDQKRGIKKEFKWLNGSFDYFLDSIPKHILLNQLYMFSKSFTISEAVDNILNCNHIIFVESFNEGIKKLGNKINIDLNPLHADKSSLKYLLSKSNLNRIQDILTPEFKLIELIKKSVPD